MYAVRSQGTSRCKTRRTSQTTLHVSDNSSATRLCLLHVSPMYFGQKHPWTAHTHNLQYFFGRWSGGSRTSVQSHLPFLRCPGALQWPVQPHLPVTTLRVGSTHASRNRGGRHGTTASPALGHGSAFCYCGPSSAVPAGAPCPWPLLLLRSPPPAADASAPFGADAAGGAVAHRQEHLKAEDHNIRSRMLSRFAGSFSSSDRAASVTSPGEASPRSIAMSPVPVNISSRTMPEDQQSILPQKH